ncbi:hypothetical protein M404DRAFT_247379 [Pisolithus tinctorius Marx 270]|uniref:Uncharacterized protein n=1 Tax=Pisolithus tinctorius Marx 270 TaxID=870435 RepID=A0A0C3NL26_PISTI|nr:hypothetical protein M404DRAFT_247379 [Pisolithus tinctorius Marx 270]
MSHDNVNIPFRVFAQRIYRQRYCDSGIAAPVYIQPRARRSLFFHSRHCKVSVLLEGRPLRLHVSTPRFV